jgi:hypothetical protein
VWFGLSLYDGAKAGAIVHKHRQCRTGTVLRTVHLPLLSRVPPGRQQSPSGNVTGAGRDCSCCSGMLNKGHDLGF